ncbi:APC family permease [Cryobacterium psychrophilum]|uniref:APC family permease n=1 Tax=Cryobacterium psychrophilum TaxID=41988 RepID=A0A4Y8KR40_9MICO|nr:APC family permease [Cryobacterium psychrophilum]TDW29613.1 amino acid/polyamine/organocation transporter (APC superfamily) [Cryobacterium psychrophilum]TFD81739.1 APC family permease [Cryobacterium psychrophilum]
MTTTPTTPQADASSSLRTGRLGVIGIVFFVVAAAAPLVGMTGAVPVAIVLGNGTGAPGAYLAVGLTLLLFSVGYAAMSQRVTNAGAFFAYIGRGLGKHLGSASAFVSILAYLAIQLAIYGFFGGLMSAQVGLLPWWAWTLLAWGVVTLLSLLSVDVGAKVLGLLMLLELAALVVTAVAILVDGGPEGLNFAASFSPGAIIAGGLAGSAGIAFAFAFASFIGFEATAIYGEESKDPKTVVPRATYLAVGVITVLFAMTAFAMVTGLGASTVVERTVELSSLDGVPLADPAAVLFGLATQYVGPWMATVMGILVLSSLFAGLLAFQNAAGRYLFALGRGGALPRPLGRVNKRGAPSAASLVTSAVTGAVIITFALFQLDPVLNLFYWFSGLAVVAIVLIEILVCIAVIVYFRRNRGSENLFQTVIAPVLAAAGLIMGEYLLMSRFGLLAGTVVEGVDPTVTAWGLSPLGWVLVSLPFVLLLVGYLWSALSRSENEALVKDVLS